MEEESVSLREVLLDSLLSVEEDTIRIYAKAASCLVFFLLSSEEVGAFKNFQLGA